MIASQIAKLPHINSRVYLAHHHNAGRFQKMAHDHLTFLQHGERKFPSGSVGGVQAPSLLGSSSAKFSYNEEMKAKSHTEKLIDVVDFLQSLPPGTKVFILIVPLTSHQFASVVGRH
jgi:hypothetical protein